MGAAGAVPPIRGGKCHLWCLAPGQRIYGRWRALVRRARRLAVGPAAGIRYYPLSRLLEKGRCPGHCPVRNERLAESIEYERPDGAHNPSPGPFFRRCQDAKGVPTTAQLALRLVSDARIRWNGS